MEKETLTNISSNNNVQTHTHHRESNTHNEGKNNETNKQTNEIAAAERTQNKNEKNKYVLWSEDRHFIYIKH